MGAVQCKKSCKLSAMVCGWFPWEEREREQELNFFHNRGILQYTDTIYIAYMHYDALVCTHMAMRSEWKRGSHSLSYRRAGPCETPSLCSCRNLSSLSRCLWKVFTCWRERGAEMFSHLLCALPSGVFIQAGIVHSSYSTSSKEKKRERESSSVCVVSPSSLSGRFCNQLRV